MANKKHRRQSNRQDGRQHQNGAPRQVPSSRDDGVSRKADGSQKVGETKRHSPHAPVKSPHPTARPFKRNKWFLAAAILLLIAWLVVLILLVWMARVG